MITMNGTPWEIKGFFYELEEAQWSLWPGRSNTGEHREHQPGEPTRAHRLSMEHFLKSACLGRRASFP